MKAWDQNTAMRKEIYIKNQEFRMQGKIMVNLLHLYNYHKNAQNLPPSQICSETQFHHLE